MSDAGSTYDPGHDPGPAYDPAARRETPLARRITDMLAEPSHDHGGSHRRMTMADYVGLCLSDPTDGYYNRRDVLGRAGDFTTAPEISQIFGELVGLWCAVAWQQLGAPARFTLVELGPGRGTLMQDAIRATAKVPGFHDAASIVLVEMSTSLRASQEQMLSGSGLPISWVSDCRELSTGGVAGSEVATSAPAIIIANEFLDALPGRTLVCQRPASARVDDALWIEQEICLSDGRLMATPAAPSGHGIAPGEGHRPDAGSRRLSALFPEATAGDIYIEQSWTGIAEMFAGFDRVAGLIIDYGHGAPTLGDTLQAVRGHRFEHPLTSPGEADLSYQVGFGELADCLRAHGLTTDGPVTQAEFLGRLGIIERASRLMDANPGHAGDIEAAVMRLMAPVGMGTRFKALGIRSPGVPPLPGLEHIPTPENPQRGTAR